MHTPAPSLWLRIFSRAGARLGVFWAVALGPAVLLLLIRLFRCPGAGACPLPGDD